MSLIENVRKRPTMYIRTVDARGLIVLVNELLDNAINQFLAKRAENIRIHCDGPWLEVEDDGEGAPFDVPHTDGSLMTHFLTRDHANDSAQGHILRGGSHGIGIAVVNALSAEFIATSWRNGRRWQQSFLRGRPTGPASFTPDHSGKGTRFRLRIDGDIFKSEEFSPFLIRQEALLASQLFPGVRIDCNDEIFHSPNGLVDLGKTVAAGILRHRTEPLRVRETIDSIAVEAVIFHSSWEFGRKRSPIISSFTNGAPTQAGTHVDGLEQAFRAVGWYPPLALIHVILHDATFSGSTKTKLDNPAARTATYRAVKPALADFCMANNLGRLAGQ